MTAPNADQVVYSHLAGQDPGTGAASAAAHSPPDAVRIAKSAGRTLKRLHEGMLEWRLAGLPVDEPQPRAG
jgi:hypothetical protein